MMVTFDHCRVTKTRRAALKRIQRVTPALPEGAVSFIACTTEGKFMPVVVLREDKSCAFALAQEGIYVVG